MKRSIIIKSPFCDTNGEVCPYLGPCETEREDEQPPPLVCWGVDDEETRMGFWREVIHTCDPDGPGYRRHVECPFGTRDIAIRMQGVITKPENKQTSALTDKCGGFVPDPADAPCTDCPGDSPDCQRGGECCDPGNQPQEARD